jgi:hypothetical protein
LATRQQDDILRHYLAIRNGYGAPQDHFDVGPEGKGSLVHRRGGNQRERLDGGDDYLLAKDSQLAGLAGIGIEDLRDEEIIPFPIKTYASYWSRPLANEGDVWLGQILSVTCLRPNVAPNAMRFTALRRVAKEAAVTIAEKRP